MYGHSAIYRQSEVFNAVTAENVVAQDLRWIADTGASMDFIGENKLSTIDKVKAKTVSDPKRCNTGNGTVTIDRQIKTRWAGRQQTNAWVMPGDAPPCISVGQKCFREGWGFYWAPRSEPIMIDPAGMCY